MNRYNGGVMHPQTSPAAALPARRRKEHLLDSFRAVLLLVFSLLVALAGSAARQGGYYWISVGLSVLALAIVVLVAVGFLPRLARRIGTEYWSGFRFLRVTRRGLLFLVLLLLIAFSTFNTGNNLLVLVLSFLLSALLVSGIASNLSLWALRLSVALPAAIHAGQTAAVLVTLVNEKRRFPSFSINLRVVGPGLDSQIDGTQVVAERLFPYIPPGAARTEKLEFRILRRGVYPLHGFQVHTRFPFGFVSRGREMPVDGRVTVYPQLVDVRALVRVHPCLAGGESRIRRGTGAGLYNVRDYRRGDSARVVHWKATAKLSKLMVKEFLEERDDSFQLVLSTWLPVTSASTLEQFEKALSWVASLAYAYRAEGRAFSFYSGEFETVVDESRDALNGLLEYLAWVVPAERQLLDPAKISPGAVLLTAGAALAGLACPRIDYLEN